MEVNNAPNLIALNCGSGKFICLVHLPCLAEANLFLDSSDNVIGIDVVKALLDEKLSHVEPLGVDYWLLRVMIPNLSFLSFFFFNTFSHVMVSGILTIWL